ncbi:hypothetical protein RIR_jg5638.t1 [Rhizophagus irregularis DAOM 181602=DAOM 197198]|nr:hypothetical protein RIR_jg5638.t1 [Rhizophagus irregularis DAOM 181602=DAOM 197198]
MIEIIDNSYHCWKSLLEITAGSRCWKSFLEGVNQLSSKNFKFKNWKIFHHVIIGLVRLSDCEEDAKKDIRSII